MILFQKLLNPYLPLKKQPSFMSCACSIIFTSTLFLNIVNSLVLTNFSLVEKTPQVSLTHSLNSIHSIEIMYIYIYIFFYLKLVLTNVPSCSKSLCSFREFWCLSKLTLSSRHMYTKTCDAYI